MSKEKSKTQCVLYLTNGHTVDVELSAEEVYAIKLKNNVEIEAKFKTKFGTLHVAPKHILAIEEMVLD